MTKDVRWLQRLNNYQSALGSLQEAVTLSQTKGLSDLEQQGLIQAFEFTHELAWNLLKDYFAYQGNPQITGSRDAAREAFQKGLVTNGEVWMEMIKSRNQIFQAYSQSIIKDIAIKITQNYLEEFLKLSKKMEEVSRAGVEFPISQTPS